MFKINDLNLLDTVMMTNLTISSPSPNLLYVDVPGRSGTLDLTESLYGLTYKDRIVEASFYCKEYDTDFYTLLLRKYQGKIVKLFLSEELFFEGRLELSDFSRFGKGGQVSIRANCHPFRFFKEKTFVEVSSTTNEKEVILKNRQMPSLVEMTTSADISVKYSNNNYSFNKGKHILPFALCEGDTKIKVQGASALLFEYQEGEF